VAIEFYLFSHERDTLRKKLPRNSPASKSLEHTTPMDMAGKPSVQTQWAVTCEQHDGRLILKLAKKWCPDAVPRITTGFWLKLR
jgi:hypothetical protein